MLDINPGSEANPAVAEWESAGLRAPDMQAVRSWRLQQIRNQLKAEDAAGIVLFDPLNIRYALDATNMQVWSSHNAVRYAFVATDGPVILFDLARCEHLTAHLELVDEVRPATGWFFFENGPREAEAATLWAKEIADLVLLHGRGSVKFENGPREAEAATLWAKEIADLVLLHGRGSVKIALDKCEGPGLAALERHGLEPVPTMRFAELARYRKHPEEIVAMRRAIYSTQQAMYEMWQALKPGITENQLWSHLHEGNIARRGECASAQRCASSGQQATSPEGANGSRPGCCRAGRGPIPGSRSAPTG